MPKEQKDQSLLNLQDLRAIIHSLKMAGLGFIDSEALGPIESRIKTLPGAEEINRIAENQIAIDALRKEIGQIMKLIEIYGNRDPEFKARYKSRTGLPPRYKVLEWRSAMNHKKRDFIREMVKASASIDDKGNGKIAGDLIRYARRIQNDELIKDDIDKVIGELKKAGFEQEAVLLKEAAFPWWEQAKGFMGGLGKGVGDVLQKAWQGGKQGKLWVKFNQIADGIESFYKDLVTLTDQAEKTGNRAVAQRMLQLRNILAKAADGWNAAVDQGEAVLAKLEEESPAETATAISPEVPEVPSAAVSPSTLSNLPAPGETVTYRSKRKPQGAIGKIIEYLDENTVSLQNLGGGSPVAVGIDQLVLASRKAFNLKKFAQK